jgi:hypothetical protein
MVYVRVAFWLLGQSIYDLQDAITRYGKVNGKAPRRIMFFRDGLSEGEYAGVGELEFQDIKGSSETIRFCRMLINLSRGCEKGLD